LAVALPIDVFYAVFKPFIWVLIKASEVALRWLGLPPGARGRIAHSEEELKMLVRASREEGVLEEEEQEMLHNVFEFADKDAADVLVPRPDVVALDVEMPVPEMLQTMLDNPYTRYPVFEGDLDDILGILHVRDLFAALHDNGIDRTDVRGLIRPAIVAPETKRLDELLEEIVGEIGDEFDRPESGVLRIGKGRVRIGGSFPIDEFNERFGTALSGDD